MINRTLFLTVATQSSGLGHLMRCLAISDALEDQGVSTHFIIDTQYDLEIVKPYEKVNWGNELNKIVPILKEYTTIFVDSNKLSQDVLDEIHNQVKTLIFIDDYYRWVHTKRMIIDWTVSVEKKEIHDKRESSEYLLGPKYTALRKEFWENKKRSIRENIDNVLITFGGSDIRSLTPRMMKIIKENFPEINMNIIVGRGFSNKQEIEAEANERTNIIFNPDAGLMKKTMMICDTAIASGGQTLYELASVGLPTIAITMIDNQVEDTLGFDETGFLFNAGWWDDELLEEKIINFLNSLLDYSTRKNMSVTGQKTIDGKGAIRIAKTIVNKTK